MSSDYSIPPLRDLSPGRLADRKQHLLAEIKRPRERERQLLPMRWRPTLLRPLALAAAFAVAAIIAVAAYAVARYVIVGSAAPPAVKASERLLDQVKGELIPRAHSGSGIEVAKTTAAVAINASTGPVYLWVAPTRAGGYCAFLQVVGTELPDGRPNLSGGCTSPPGPKLDIGMNTISVHGHMLALLVVHAASPAQTIAIRFRNGADRTLRLGTSGFLVAEMKPSDQVTTVSSRDAHGLLLAQEQVPSIPAPPNPIGPFRAVAEIRTIGANKPLVLRVAPATRGMRCASFAPAGGAGGICNKPPRPNQIDVNPNQRGAAPHGMLLLWGSVGRLISSLELHFEDGAKIPIPLHHGWALYQVNPRNFIRGHRPITLIGRNRSGRVVDTRRLGPYEP